MLLVIFVFALNHGAVGGEFDRLLRIISMNA
jgi:hypothetical protein